MPLKKGGKRNRRAKSSTTDTQFQRAPTANAREGQMYALAEKMLGNRRMLVKCADGKERMAIIPGKFKGRRHWVNTGMLLMLNIRGYQDDKADVIYVYNPDEMKRLKRDGELDDLIDKDVENACGFEFGVEENDNNDSGSSTDETEQPVKEYVLPSHSDSSSTSDSDSSSTSDSDSEEIDLDDL